MSTQILHVIALLKQQKKRVQVLNQPICSSNLKVKNFWLTEKPKYDKELPER